MNLNFKTICSVAVLMCLVPAVFGMQDGKRSCPDESAEPYSKVRMITVSERKTLNKSQLKEELKSARQERKSAQKNVKIFLWLCKDALDRAQSADKRAKIITKLFGEDACLKQGIPQDKAKAEQDVKIYGELFRDAKNRKENADIRIYRLTRMIEERQATDDKVIPGSYTPEPYSYTPEPYFYTPEPSVNFSISTDQEVRDVRMAEHNDIQSLTNNGSATDNESPVLKLNEYLRDERTKDNLLDIDYIYDLDNGAWNCIILLTKNGKVVKEFNLDQHCKSKKEAKNSIAEHVYNFLISKEANTENSPQASSSGTNQQSSFAVNGNTTADLYDSSSRRTSVASGISDSDNSDKSRMIPSSDYIIEFPGESSSDSSDSDSSDSDNETFTLAINMINSERVETKRGKDGTKMLEMRV